MLFILIALVYLTVAAYVQPKIHHYLACLCSNCSTGREYTLRSSVCEPGDGHDGSYGFAMIWPVVMPFVFMNRQQPRVQLASKRINDFWEQKTAQYHEEQLRELEERAGMGR